MDSEQVEDAGMPEFEALVHRQSRFVFRVAYAMLRNSHDVEDVVQETFMNIYRSGTWRNLKDERAFLARAAWRLAVSRARSRSRREKQMAIMPEQQASEAGPEELLIWANSCQTIHRLIDALPEELRQPLALSTVNEMNSREIAAILGIPEGTVRTRLMRARQVLKAKLAAVLEVRNAK